MAQPGEALIQKLERILRSEGGILFSAVPERVAPLNYSDYSGGQKLKPWLLSFPQFAASEDGRWLTLAGGSAPVPKESPRELPRQVRAMHAFAYTGYWNQNLKQLKQLGVGGELKMEQLRDHIGRRMMEALLTGQLEEDGSGLWLDTGLTLPGGEPVWAVLERNPLYEGGDKHYWLMKGFRVRENRLPDPASVRERLEALEEKAAALRSRTEGFLAALVGLTRPESGFAQAVSEYEEDWRQLLAGFPGLPQTLSGIRESLSRESLHTELLQRALGLFEEMTRGLESFFAGNRWMGTTPATDRERVRSLGPEELRQLLAAYRCLREAMASQTADDAFYDNYLAAGEHFPELPGIRVAPRVLIGIPEEERAFLNQIEQIGSLLDRYAAGENRSAGGLSLPEPGELLKLALAGGEEYRQNWHRYLKALYAKNKEGVGSELTCSGAAETLLAAGDEALAEYYLILGLTQEPQLCAGRLRRLYRETEQQEKFLLLWEEPDSCEGEEGRFALRCLCAREPERALRLAEEHMALSYRDDCLEPLIAAARSLGRTELAQELTERLARFSREPNFFEQAVISGDSAGIAEAINSEALSGLDYDAALLRSRLEAGDYPEGAGDYDIGRRLYRFQGNRNSLAERWLWRGEGKGSRAELLLLLTNERRWEEAVRFYEGSAETQKRYEACRRFYLIARFYRSPASAREVFAENLQDVLEIMRLKPSFRARLAGEDAEFYARLVRLCDALDEPYLWSVVCEDRSLRERVNDRAQLERLGLDVEKTGRTFREGGFPHGRNAGDIAARLCALAGNCRNAAETAAMLAGDEALLWEIYTGDRNENALYELLKRNDTLQQAHPEETLDLLYRRRSYSEFLERLAAAPREGRRLQRAVAELKLGLPLTDAPERIAGAAAGETPEQCRELLRAAVDAGHPDLAAGVIRVCFENWLTDAPEELPRLLDCCGSALLERLQAAGPEPLAVYLYNVMGIGEEPQQAEALYRRLLRQLESGSAADRLTCVRRLRQLYPARTEELNAVSAELSVRLLLEQSGKDAPERLAQTLRELEPADSLLNALLEALPQRKLLWEYPVCAALTRFARKLSRLEDVVRGYHAGRGSAADREPLVKLYYAALTEDCFPMDIAGEAEAVCLQALDDSPTAALCLCLLERLMGKPLRAQAVWLYRIAPMEQTLAQLPPALKEPQDPVTGTELLERLFESCSEEEILEHLRFCAAFVREDAAAERELRSGSDTGRQSELAVRLLCADPENGEYWELCNGSALELEGEARSKFLRLCSRKNPAHWKELVASSPDRQHLAGDLTQWAAAPDPYGQECRIYLEQRLEQEPGYLAGLELNALVERLCGQLKAVSQGWNHAQIRSVSRIALETRDPACLERLRQDAGQLLFGVKSDLGVVVAARLLLAGRYAEARCWIGELAQRLAVILLKYRPLIDELSRLTEAELAAWSAVPANRSFLGLILPDGNQPNAEQVTRVTQDALRNGTEAETAGVLIRLLKVFPEDYVSACNLVELAKTGFDGFLPALHFGLVNLLRIAHPSGNVSYPSPGTEQHNAKLLAIVGQVILYSGAMDSVLCDWDFQETTAQGLDRIGATPRNFKQIIALEQRIRDSLDNRSDRSRSLRLEGWLAAATGDWTEYLLRAFREDPEGNAIFVPGEIPTEPLLTRSLLRVFRQIPGEERPRLRKWLRQFAARAGEAAAAARGSGKPSKAEATFRVIKSQTELVLKLEEEGIEDKLGDFPLDRILGSRLENREIFRQLCREVLELHLTRESVTLMCALTGSAAAAGELKTQADQYFASGQDRIAWFFYEALYRTEPALRFSKNRHWYELMETYQTRMRLAGAFAGDRNCLKELSAADLSPWTILNLVLTLAQDSSGRAEEILRLKEYLDPGKVPYVRQALKLLDSGVDDREKVSVTTDPALTPMEQYYLVRLLKFPYEHGDTAVPYYLAYLPTAAELDFRHRELYRAVKGTPEEKKYHRTLLPQGLDYAHLSPLVKEMWNDRRWEQMDVRFHPGYVYREPPCAAAMTPVACDSGELRLLREEYIRLQADYPGGHFAEKAELAGRIYRRTMAAEPNQLLRYRALLRWGVDRFYELVTDRSRQEAAELLLQLLETDGGENREGREYAAFTELVNTLGPGTLLREGGSIRALAKGCAEHRAAFRKLQSMLTDPAAVRDLGIITDQLENLDRVFALYDDTQSTTLVHALDEAAERLRTVNALSLADSKGQLQRLIRAERNRLARRAFLEVRIQNQGSQPRQGFLYGIVTNQGTVAAEELTLQVSCGENAGSPPYTLARLQPGGKAVFEIPYSLSQDKESLKCAAELTGRSGDGIVSARAVAELPIGETSGSSLLFNTYSTDRTGKFVYNPETGRVENDKFFGRTVETARLRELVSGEDFSGFHSAVVYGVRRTGKTSLLEYFGAYVRGAKPDCLCIRVDVQLTDETVRGVFVDGVLKADAVRAALEESADRERFLERWSGGEEVDPAGLRDFFRELKEQTGRGLILIIDEIDRLFKRLMDDHLEGLLNSLLKSVSGILDDAACRELVHLVLCGSNWLMYYAAVGHDMQQLFHRLGDYKLSVGRLPKEDVLALLKSAGVDYTPEALEMIWEYTGGLVWFVKLLGNAAIRRAKSRNRAWIYPADVFYSLPEVLCDRNCEQFYEGCVAGSLERQLIDLMQSLACRKDMYLSLESLCQKLEKTPGEVEQALNGLIRFDIVQRSPANPDMVRFCLDIYRRYFRTVHSAYKRIPEEPAVFERKYEGPTVLGTAERFDEDERL